MTVYEAIQKITTEKKSKNIYPSNALILDVKRLSGLYGKEFSKEIRKLIKDGKVGYIEIVNSFSYYLK